MIRTIAIAAFALAAWPVAANAQDAVAGEKVFNQCKTCHEVGPGAKVKIGPPLTGVVGRQAASWPGFAYSETLKKKSAEIGTWDEAKLDGWLSGPAKYAGGTVKMMYQLADPTARKNVIAYLATQK